MGAATLALATLLGLLASLSGAAERYCSDTTNVVFQACQREVADDYLIAYGEWVNAVDRTRGRTA